MPPNLSILFLAIALIFYPLANRTAAQATGAASQKSQADSLLAQADIQQEKTDLPQALAAYESAWLIYQEIGEQRGMANAALGKGSILLTQCRYEECQKELEIALRLFRQIGDRHHESIALGNLGILHKDLAQYDLALEQLGQAAQICRENSDRAGEGRALSGMGMVYLNRAQYDQALDLFTQALLIARELNDREEEGRSLNHIGGVYDFQSDYPRALDYYQEALKASQEQGDRANEAEVLNNIGVVHGFLCEYQTALDYYQQSLKISEQLGDLGGVSRAMNNIGYVLMNLTDYGKALKYYGQDLEACRQRGDARGEGQSLLNVGAAYYYLYDFERALECFQQSLEISQRLDDRMCEAMTLGNIGGVYQELGDVAKSIEYFQADLKAARDIQDRRGESITLNNLGAVCFAAKDYDQASGYYQSSLEISRELGDKVDECLALCNRGELESEQGHYDRALTTEQEALALAQGVGAADYEHKILQVIAGCQEALGQDSLATLSYGQAVTSAEQVRGRLQVEGQKTTYASSLSGIYEALILTLLRQNKIAAAYNYAERARARSFLDLLAAGQMRLGKPKDQEILQREKELVQQREEFETPEGATASDSAKLTLRGKITQTENEFMSLLAQRQQTAPEVLSLVSVNPLTLVEVQALLDKKTTLLEYYLTKEKTIVWVVTRRRVELFEIPVGGDSLKNLVLDFRRVIESQGDTAPCSQRLYRILFAPLEKAISTNALVVVAHGILHYLPFQALQNEEGKYLVERFQLSYLPSASVLKYLQGKRRGRGEKLLALGDPSCARSDYEAIPHARQEVRQIAKLWPQSRVLTDTLATEARFKAWAADYDILHLACHGDLNAAYPLYSSLLLAPDDKDDGELTVQEIFGLDLNATLVVLSGCQTGLGHLTNGDEVVGLSRAFLYAGTPAIVSSLWAVGDESTAYFMSCFYRNLSQTGKAEALRLAQLETRRKYPHPYAWAPFILTGVGAD